MAKITVVIPVYNVEEYLECCLRSVLNQSFSDLEVILVDDGSTDSSGKICDKYLYLDNRIKVIHQENQGLSAARNKGIEHAAGAYVSFIDSDDFIDVYFYEKLYGDIQKYKADIACCGYKKVYDDFNIEENKNEKQNMAVSAETKSFSSYEILEKLLLGQPEGNHIACNKLYKISLFDDVKYPVGRIYEDAFTTYKLFYKAERVSYNYSEMYFYYQRKDSIMSRSFDMRSMDKMAAAWEVEAFIEEKAPSLKKQAECFTIISALRLMYDILKSDTRDTSFTRDICVTRDTEKYKAECLKVKRVILDKASRANPFLSLRHKIMISVFKTNKWLYRKIWEIYLKKS